MLIPPRYMVRALKSILYIALLFLVIFLVIFTLAEPTREGLTFIDFIAVNNWPQMIVFIILFGCAYPMISFARKEVALDRPFNEGRDDIVKVFTASGYELAADRDGALEFRLRNKFHRIMRLFMEDALQVDYSRDDAIVITGMRKDVHRLGRHLEHLNHR